MTNHLNKNLHVDYGLLKNQVLNQLQKYTNKTKIGLYLVLNLHFMLKYFIYD
jgi:hypothetical protein